ncbi:MAG TPA: 1-deoxy-D-xylulose-5-phosphate reductoisomerase [Acidimicrobiales bacterium]|nr:1-deoxy-D-xylulose-5-phosphate reductoisomerase [Acidimicrobiales bacterium]
MRDPRRVSIVGSTGSIGCQALDVISTARDDFLVEALGANRSVADLARQAVEFRPKVVAIGDAARAAELAAALPRGVEVRAGAQGLASLGELGDVVLNAVVGFAGLEVTVRALRSGRRLALANKESLVAGAPVVQVARASKGAEIIPVDSEHCAIHQCLGERRQAALAPGRGGAGAPAASADVARLVLTASGGPFRGRAAEELASVTVGDALAHPTWQMGPKITIDSSTLMNKGLEVIEAHELFGVDYGRIEVVVHPQSIVHSMVEFCDGATIAQLSQPDMRLPIGYALAYPERFGEPYGRIDWREVAHLDFASPDPATFPCLGLALEAGRAGGSAPAWLNAANEVAVGAFLAGRISWPGIAAVVAETLAAHEPTALVEIEDVLAADAAAREIATGASARQNRSA